MPHFDKTLLLKVLPILLFVGFVVLFSSSIHPKVAGDNKTQSVSKVTTENDPDTSTDSASVKVETGSNNVNVNVNNSTSENQNTATTSQTGTCTQTVNGVTTTVPADKVNINQTGPGDKTVSVKCDNTYSSSTNNNTSIKNNININSSQ